MTSRSSCGGLRAFVIGYDISETYVELATRRLNAASEKGHQLTLESLRAPPVPHLSHAPPVRV